MICQGTGDGEDEEISEEEDVGEEEDSDGVVMGSSPVPRTGMGVPVSIGYQLSGLFFYDIDKICMTNFRLTIYIR